MLSDPVRRCVLHTKPVPNPFPQLQAPAPSPSGLSQLLACPSQGSLVTLKLWDRGNDLPHLQMKVGWRKGVSDLRSHHCAAETGRRQPRAWVSKCPLFPHLLRKLESWLQKQIAPLTLRDARCGPLNSIRFCKDCCCFCWGCLCRNYNRTLQNVFLVII